MQLFWTILSGVTVFVVSQFILRLVIEPIAEMKKTIAQISHLFIEDGWVIHNPGVPALEKEREVSKRLKYLSAQLHSHLFLIPFYDAIAFFSILPPPDDVRAASKDLMWLSNSYDSKNDKIYEWISKKRERICDSLGIYIPDDERWLCEEGPVPQQSIRCLCLGFCLFNLARTSGR